MSRIIIQPPAKPIRGTVTLSGAKNSALKVLAASVLTEEEVILDNIPLNIKDVQIALKMLKAIGAYVQEEHPGRVRIRWAGKKVNSKIPDTFGSIRTSLLFLGGLLARIGYASVPLPGGCQIGERKYDLHLMALQKLGAVCHEGANYIRARSKKLIGAQIEFPIRTTGGTENTLLASVCAQGRTVIYNAHTRPEVYDLIEFLNRLGAHISVPGSGVLEVEGVERLQGGHHVIIYDNMEAMTFVTFAAITKGRIAINHFPEQDLEIPMIYLRESGIKFIRQGTTMTVERPEIITPFDLSTSSYPGINSDMQPLFVVLATQAHGKSKITDIRFENRFQYVAELQKMGANITVENHTVIVKGPTKLRGACVRATDLRGGAALTAAALVAEGQTIIEQAEQIERGYEHFEEKLAMLGVDVTTQQDKRRQMN